MVFAGNQFTFAGRVLIFGRYLLADGEIQLAPVDSVFPARGFQL